jgi:hypothetical protein
MRSVMTGGADVPGEMRFTAPAAETGATLAARGGRGPPEGRPVSGGP